MTPLHFARVVVLAVLLLPCLVVAAPQQAHTHGIATLMMALEQGTLEIQFESPATNLVGFEHKASSEKERNSVLRTEAILKESMKLFSFAGTHCQVKDLMVDASSILQPEHEGHEQKEVHEDDHHHDHIHENKESGHSEISARYHFHCEAPDKLEGVTVLLFNLFPGIDKIRAAWITDEKQSSVNLTPSENVILFR